MLDRDALEVAFRQQAWDLLPPTELGRMPVVAIDGKTLKGSSPTLSRTYKEYEEKLFAKKLNADPAGAMPAPAKAAFPASIVQ
jgi:NaMN:DMB phosphoribosyltransferase